MQVWPGLGRRGANPSQNPISPSHIGNAKSAGIPTCGFISFHDLNRPGEGCGDP